MPLVSSSSTRSTVRNNLALGMSTMPNPASRRMPSQGTHVPKCRFSSMAMIKRSSVTRRIQALSSRIARCTPTTAKMGSSVYMCTM